MTRLPGMLKRLEDAWIGGGMPSTAWLRPGVDPRETERRLAEAGLAVPTEIAEWFAWHEGAHGLKSAEGFWTILGPSGFHPQTIDQALEERRVGLELRQELIEGEGIPKGDVADWLTAWLSIGRAASGTVMVADLGAGGADQAPIFVIDWEDCDSFSKPLASSLSSVVATWLEVLEGHSEWVGGLETWRVRFGEVPIPLRGLL